MITPLASRKVLIVARSTTAHPNSGGMETSAAALVSALQVLGATTALLTTDLPNGVLPAGYQAHERVWTISTPKPGRYSREWWRQTGWTGPWATWGPDLILGIGDAAGSFTRPPEAPVPVIVHCHGTTVMETRSALATRGLGGIARALLNVSRTPTRRRHLQAASGVIAAGPAIAESLARRPFKLTEPRVSCISNSIEPMQFQFSQEDRDRHRAAMRLGDSEPHYLVAGRLARDKGIDLAIEALAMAPEGRLTIAGSGPAGDALQQRVTELRLQKRIRFEGRVSHRRLAELMSAADQLVFPTRRSEGLPMILLEAAAAGLPILTTQRAAVPRSLRSDVVVIVEPAPAEVQKHLLPSPAKSREAYLPDEFSVATIANRLEECLRRWAFP